MAGGRFEPAPSGKTRSPKVSARGRICEVPGCTTMLSIYNEAPVCSLHERGAKWGHFDRTHH